MPIQSETPIKKENFHELTVGERYLFVIFVFLNVCKRNV